jgi:hypothetical protein
MQIEKFIETKGIEFNLARALENISGNSFVFTYIQGFGINIYPRNIDNVPIGGSGITKRSLTQVLSRFDDSLREDLLKSSSVIFFGNGLSLAPIELKRSHIDKKISIVDMIDYEELERTYYENEQLIMDIARSLRQSDAESFLEIFRNAILLNFAQNNGEINIFKHSFGSGEILDMGMYDLGINCFGPPSITIPEQLCSITPRGKIYYRGSLSKSSVINQI